MRVFFLYGSNISESVLKQFCGAFLILKNNIRTRLRMKHSGKIQRKARFLCRSLNLLLIKYNGTLNREIKFSLIIIINL